MKDLLIKMAALEEVVVSSDTPEAMHASIVFGRIKAFLILPGGDVEEEKKKLREELKYAQGFVKSVEGKLSNEKFVANAPEAGVERERKKVADGKGRVAMYEERVGSLRA